MAGRENTRRRIATNQNSIKKLRQSRACITASAGAVLALCATTPHASASSTYTWDASGNAGTTSIATDGSGTWGTANANWYTSGADSDWSNTGNNIAIFGNGGTPGNITLGTGVTAGGITFNPVAGSLNGGSLYGGLYGNLYNISGASTITLAGTTPTIFVNGSNAVITSVIAGTAGLTVSGTGTLALAISPTYSGGTTINAGATLQLGYNNATTNINSGGAIVDNGTLQYDRTDGNASLASPVTVTGSGGISEVGIGNVTFNEVLGYTGKTTINSGAIVIGTGGNLNASSSLVFGGGVTSNATLTISTARTTSIVVSGTTLNPGIGILGVGASLGSAGNTFNLGTITQNAGGLLNFGTLPTTGSISTTSQNVNIVGGSQTILGGWAFIPAAGQDLNFATVNASTGVISALATSTPVTSNATLAAAGGADINLSGGAYTSSSALTVNSMKFFTGAPTLTLNAPLTVATGGVLIGNVGGAPVTINGSSTITSGTNSLDFVLNSNAVTPLNISASIVDNGSPVGLTTGVANGKLEMTLSGSNTFSGDTNVNSVSAGGNDTNIIIANPLALQNSTINWNNSGNSNIFFGTTAVGGSITQATLGGLKGSTNFPVQALISGNTIGSAVAVNLSIGNNNQSNTYAGVLTDSGSVTKIGTGTWTLTGTNAITGNTNINSGTVKLIGTATLGNSPVITIAPGATFDVSGLASPLPILGTQTVAGTGTILGGTSFASGAQLSPGVNASTFVGTLATGSLNMASGSILNEYFGTPGVLGSPGISGLVSVTGNVILPSSGLKINLYDNGNNNSQGSIAAGVYDILNYTGSLSGFSNTSTFTVVNTPLVGRTYTFTNTGSQIDLTIGSAAASITWTGAVSGSWDTTPTTNWANGASASAYANPNAVTFGDTSAITGNPITNSNIIVQAGGVTPSTVTFSANSVNYNVSNAGGDLVGISGSTGITKTGTDTLTLNGPNTFTGPVNINAGIVNISNGNALGAIGALSGANVSSGAALQLMGNITTNAQPLKLNGTGVSSSGALNNLTGSNTYAGPVTLAGASTVTATSGTLSLTGGINTSGNPLTVNGPGNVNINTGAISGSGSLTYNGTGTLALGTGHTFTGGTTIASGIVNVAGDTSFGAVPSTASTNITFSGNATLQAGASNVSLSANRIVSIGSGVTATFDTNGNSMAVNGAITGSSANGINKIGNGTLSVGSSNTYAGVTTISGGTLALNPGVPTAPLPGAVVQIDASKLSGSVTTVPNLGTGGGSYTVTGAAPTLSSSTANEINGHQALVFNTNGALISSSAYSNTGSQMTLFIVEQSNNNSGYAGEASFIGPNSSSDYSGAGNLAVEDDNTGGADVRAVVPNNQVPAELVRVGATPLVWDTTVNLSALTTSARLTANSNGAAATNTASGTLNGSTSAAFNISQSSIGGRWASYTAVGSYWSGEIGEVLIYNTALTPTQTQAVESYLDGKWLGIGGGSLPSTTTLAITGGSSFDLNGNNQTIASLVNSNGTGGMVTNSNATLSSVLTVSQSGSSTFGGVIQNGNSPVGLTISGGGTQILTGANTFTGPTTITSGKLVVGSGGTLGATAVTVANGGIFAPNPGTGSISIASLNLNNGGIVDMTDGAAGTLNLTGSGIDLTIGSAIGAAATLNFDLGASGSDKIVDTGSASVIGTSNINITALGSSLSNGTYSLISATGGLSGNFQFSNGATTETMTVGSTVYSLSLINSPTAESLVVVVPGITSAWTGTNSTVWADAGNWSGGVPGSTSSINNLDTAVFNSSPSNLSPVVDAGRNVQNITFDTSSVGAVNLTGATLTLTGNGITQATSTVQNDETISVPLVLEGNYSFLSNSANNNALILNGNISGGTAAGTMTVTLGGTSLGGGGSGVNAINGSISNGAATSIGLMKAGAGTWYLGASNSYTGGTTISGGILNIVNGALGSTGNVVFNGGILQYATGASQDLSARIIGSTDVVRIDTNGNAVTFASPLASSNLNGLTKYGAGTLTLSASNTYLGATTVNAGALNIANSSALPSATTVTVASGAALQLSGGVTVSTTPVSLAGTGVSGAGVLENVTGSNNYAGPITMTGDSTFGSDAGLLTVSGNVSGSNTNLTLTGAGNGTISGAITTGSGALTQNSPGTWVLSGTSTYSGGTTLNAGITQISAEANLGAGTGAATINSATLEVTSSLASYRNLSLGSSTSTIQTDPGVTYTANGAISGGGTLNKTGTGTLVLPAGNSYGGGTNITAGTVIAGNAASLGSSTVTLSGSSPVLQILPTPLGVSGFGGSSHSGWTLNRFAGDPGTAPFVSAGNVLSITSATNGEARTAFYDTPVPYASFTASFVYQESVVNGGADGIGFVLQNSAAGPNAVGQEGGNIAINGIGTSAAIAWELYNNEGVASASNGNLNAFAPTTPAGLLASGDPILVTVTGSANSSSLAATFLDQASSGTYQGDSYSMSYSLSGTLSSLLGGSTAYVGFSGTTGGLNAVQNISNFTYTVPPMTGAISMGNNVVAQTNSTIDVSYTGGVTLGTLTVNSGSKLTLTNSQASGTALLTVTGLTNSGILDITKDAVDVQNGSISGISAQIAAAYSNGTWTGTNPNGVITSSLAAADTAHLTAVGVATGLTTFEGQAVNPTDVLIKYTYYGDADLSGVVDGSDYSRIDNGYLQGLTGWQNGDFNYDGVIDGSDYTLIDNSYNTQGAALSAQLASPTAQIAGGSSSSVPEPTTLGLMGVAAIGLLGRRRRRV